MKRRINNKFSFAISMTLGICAIAGAVFVRPISARPISARPIEEAGFSRDCIHAQQLLDEFRGASGTFNEADMFALDSPLGGQHFQVRWIDVGLPGGFDKIDPEQDDPETTPETLPATGLRSASVEMIFFERFDSYGSDRGLEGCVIWSLPSTDKIDPEQDDPETTPKTLTSPHNAWIQFSLPPHVVPDDMDRDHQGREDLFWWLLGLVEVTKAGR